MSGEHVALSRTEYTVHQTHFGAFGVKNKRFRDRFIVFFNRLLKGTAIALFYDDINHIQSIMMTKIVHHVIV